VNPRLRGGLAALALLASGGCAYLSFAPRAMRECPGAIRSTDEIAGDLRLDLRFRVRSERVDSAMRVAVEKRGSDLVLVGLSPLGVVLFSVRQTGTDTEVEALPAALLEIPPENVLRDVHRVYFLSASAPLPANGESDIVRDGTRIREQWRDGVLRSRRFERVKGHPRGEVVVDFVSRPREGLAEARIRNGWCDYEATLVTLTEER
jgi:hypothetical protein